MGDSFLLGNVKAVKIRGNVGSKEVGLTRLVKS